MKFKEKLIGTKFYKPGKAVAFRIDKIRLPNGKTATREFLDHPGAVGIVPVLPNGNIVIVKQYRHPVRQVTWEIPAGKLDKGGKETTLSCAKRELAEETGYTAKRWKKLLSFWPTAAFANEVIHVFLATGLRPGATNLDDDEFVGCFELSLPQALQAIASGKIRDSKTIIGILGYKELFLRNSRRLGRHHRL